MFWLTVAFFCLLILSLFNLYMVFMLTKELIIVQRRLQTTITFMADFFPIAGPPNVFSVSHKSSPKPRDKAN